MEIYSVLPANPLFGLIGPSGSQFGSDFGTKSFTTSWLISRVGKDVYLLFNP